MISWVRIETHQVVQENLSIQVDQAGLGCILGLPSHLKKTKTKNPDFINMLSLTENGGKNS